MVARMALSWFGLAVAAALVAAPQARAQCRLCDQPTTTSDPSDEAPVTLEIEAGLDFDRLIVLGTGEGSATLRPDGTRQVSGTIEAISGRAMVGVGRVRGEPGRPIRIDLPRRIDLYSLSGGSVTIDEIVTDLPAIPRLDPSGRLSFRFGGRIRISGDAEGDYRGDVPIMVEYL